MEANGLICVLGTWFLCNGCLLVVDLITNRENIRANWLKKNWFNFGFLCYRIHIQVK